ncbi:MAG: hypothetical protein GY830_10850 [Bacteroidetes bacterium]|nr:hypothetical protein [Bacteroidota bacterium]
MQRLRLISGSACRSIYSDQFVLWNKGQDSFGMDSFGMPLDYDWEELCISIIIIDDKNKEISSRDAMRLAVTSPFYEDYKSKNKYDLKLIIEAIKNKDFNLLGKTTENNCLAMHKVINTTAKPTNYLKYKTKLMIDKILKIRNDKKLQLYFTIDAGPNIKILYLRKDKNPIFEQLEYYDIKII